MEDPTTTAMNLTYAGTLVIGVVMFFGVAAAFVITLLLAGLGRLIATLGKAFFGRRAGAPVATKRRPKLKPARKEPQISPEWAAAVERADARARAEAAAAPDVTVSVRELPAAGRPERKAS